LVSLRGSDYVDSISSRDERSSETVEEIAGSPHNPALFIMRTAELVARALAPGSDFYAGGQSMGGSQVDETTDETRGAT